MMPKKQSTESPKEQSERFRKAVQDMVDAGELSPTEAEERFSIAVGRIVRKGSPPADQGPLQ